MENTETVYVASEGTTRYLVSYEPISVEELQSQRFITDLAVVMWVVPIVSLLVVRFLRRNKRN